MGYRVDLGLLASKIGITDKPHRMTIRRQVMASFAGRRHGGKDVSIAISNLLIGPPYAANHTPEASHLDRLEAVAGPGLVDRAYADVTASDAPHYLWHEFGDSMLLLP